MRARYDLGFGHPVDPAGIAGVAKLKAGAGSLDQQLSDGLAANFQKLLDPLLPLSAFRISWLIVEHRGRADPQDVTRRADLILAPLERQLGLTQRIAERDTATSWFRWRWQGGPTLMLAWYQPKATAPAQFQPVWE